MRSSCGCRCRSSGSRRGWCSSASPSASSTSSSSTPNVSENSGGPSNSSSTRRHTIASTTLRRRVPRPQLRRNPHHLGPDVRNLRSRNPPAHLRTHDAGRNVQHLEAPNARICCHCSRLEGVDIVAAASRLRVRPARLGAESRGHFSRIHSPVALSRSRATARVAPIPKAGVAFSAENWANRLGRDRRS